jgi:hypothetical protein
MVRSHKIGVDQDHKWCIFGENFQTGTCATYCERFVLSIHYETIEMKETYGRNAFATAQRNVFAHAGRY